MKNLRYLSLLSLVLLSCIGSALALPTVTPAPSVTPVPVENNPPGDSYVVSADVLEVRAAPGETSLNVGYLEVGETVTVYIIIRGNTLEKCSAWARVGRGRWACADRLERK
jgi:uncharacterized protein YgiM (DUF1202 family)